MSYEIDRVSVATDLITKAVKSWTGPDSEETGTKIVALGKRYQRLQFLSETIKDFLKEVDTAWTDVEAALQDAMIEEGCKSINVSGLGQFTMRARNMLSVNVANKTTLFFPYLTEVGHDSILKLDVNPRTLGAFLDSHYGELQAKYEGEGLDAVEARDKALEFLKTKGVTYFVKRDIAFKKGE